MLMAADKNAKPKSEAEKKFDDLLNNKCSWTYKSIKTIKCQTREENDENGSILKIRTVNIEETAYNHDSDQKDSIYLLNGYDNMEADTKKKPKKNMKLPTKSRNAKIVKRDSIQGNRNTSQPLVTSDRNTSQPMVTSVKNMQTSAISKRNKRNLTPVSYAESDSESVQSSSDDGLIFLSRECDERLVNGNRCDTDDNNRDINEISNICAVESNYNTYDTNDVETSQEDSLKKYTETNNYEASNYQNFKPQSYDGINEGENNFDQEETETRFQDQNAVLDKKECKTRFQDQNAILDQKESETGFRDQNDGLYLLFDDDYRKSNLSLNSTVNPILQKETDLPSSETLSSLSEWDGDKFEEKNKPLKKENVSNKNDLDSEIIRQYMTISTEVQSVCDELETPNDDEIFNDFFNGNFNLDKYKSKINADESASIRKGREENISYKYKLLSETKLDDSPKIHSHTRISSNEKVTNRKSGNAKDAKGKRQELDNKTNSKNKDASKVRSLTREKRNYNSNFDDDNTPSVQSDKDEAGNDELEVNEYPVIDDYKMMTKLKRQEPDNKTNPKNKDASKVRSSTRVKGNYISHFDGEYTPSVRSEKYDTGNDDLGGNECPVISDSKMMTKDTKRKRQEFDNKTNSKNKDASKARSSTREKKNYNSNFNDDNTPSVQSDKDESGNDELEVNEYPVIDDYKMMTKGKRQEPDNKTNPKNKDASKVRSSTKVKKNYSYNSNSDDDYTPSVRREKGESGNDELGGNEYPVIDDYKMMTKGKRQEPDNKTNSKNKNASKVRSSPRVKGNYSNISNFDEDYTPSVRSDKDEAGNDDYGGNECPVIDDYFKGKSFNSQAKNRTFDKNKQKRINSEGSTHDVTLEQNAKSANKPQLLEKKDLKLSFPNKSDVVQQPSNSKTEKKESVSLRNVTDGSSAKCAKRTPKTWEDLEADILNREEQISLMPLFESELSPTYEEFLKDGKFHHIGMNQNNSSFNKPAKNFETENTKTQNKWAIVKSGQGNCDHLTSSKNVNDVAFDSPNASIIDRVIRRMQLCTTPVLTPSKVMPQLEEHHKSPIVTEHSYSVQEIKSVFLTAEKNLNKKQTEQLKTTWKNTKQKNYRLCRKREIKTVIDSNGASITNQTSVKLNEIPRKKNRRLSKSSESDESMPESNKISEMESSTPESAKSLSFPQDVLVSSVDEPYNLRKRKCKDNAYRQNTTKKRSIIRANNMTKNNTMTEYKRNKTDKQSKQNTVPLIENPTREDISIENFTSLNKRKKYIKSNSMNSSTDDVDESEPQDSSQNGTSSTGTIYQQDGYLEKSNGNLKTLNKSNQDISSQTNALLASGNKKGPGQNLGKQVYDANKSMTANRPKRKLPKRDSKEEYEKYLQNIFSKDITEDSNAQWELLNGTNETSGKNLLGKDNNYSSTQKLLTENSDEDLLSLSSDTDFEEQPSQRRASGLLDDVFN